MVMIHLVVVGLAFIYPANMVETPTLSPWSKLVMVRQQKQKQVDVQLVSTWNRGQIGFFFTSKFYLICCMKNLMHQTHVSIPTLSMMSVY